MRIIKALSNFKKWDFIHYHLIINGDATTHGLCLTTNVETKLVEKVGFRNGNKSGIYETETSDKKFYL